MGALIGIGALINRNTFAGGHLFEKGSLVDCAKLRIITVIISHLPSEWVAIVTRNILCVIKSLSLHFLLFPEILCWADTKA